jgi:putative transcriptional regulator
MSIRHHVSDDLLFDFVTGRLAEPWSIAIATHLALCPACRDREDLYECAGGSALDQIAPVAMDDDAIAACLALARPPVAAEPAPSPTAATGGFSPVFPEPLRSYVGGDLADVRWSTVGGGVRQRILSTGNERRSGVTRLLYIPPGEPVPEHSHRGLELTLVLSGNFRDDQLVFQRGDLEIADETTQHMPIAGVDDPCICLAVTDAPLRFKSFLPRLIQPFVKI